MHVSLPNDHPAASRRQTTSGCDECPCGYAPGTLASGTTTSIVVPRPG